VRVHCRASNALLRRKVLLRCHVSLTCAGRHDRADLIAPCACAGTSAQVHRPCLDRCGRQGPCCSVRARSQTLRGPAGRPAGGACSGARQRSAPARSVGRAPLRACPAPRRRAPSRPRRSRARARGALAAGHFMAPAPTPCPCFCVTPAGAVPSARRLRLPGGAPAAAGRAAAGATRRASVLRRSAGALYRCAGAFPRRPQRRFTCGNVAVPLLVRRPRRHRWRRCPPPQALPRLAEPRHSVVEKQSRAGRSGRPAGTTRS